MIDAYKTIKIGSPLDKDTLLGPVYAPDAVKEFEDGIAEIKKQGGKILYGGKKINREGYFVEPTVVEIPHDKPIVQKELFVPICFVFKFKTLEEAI